MSRRFGIVGVTAFIAAYVASIVLYVDSGMGHPQQITEGPSSGDGTTVIVDIEEIQSNNSVLVANLTVTPGSALLDPRIHGLREDLSVVVTSAVTPASARGRRAHCPMFFVFR